MSTKTAKNRPAAPGKRVRGRELDPGEAVARSHGVERSPEWPRVEKAHLAREPRCVVCGKKARKGQAVQVHHVFPFHFCVLLGRPDLELDERNLITLCQSERGRPEEDHHLLVGHLDDFESSNLAVRADARVFQGMTGAQIRASPKWKAKVARRLEPIGEMSEREKADLRAEMDRELPAKTTTSANQQATLAKNNRRLRTTPSA